MHGASQNLPRGGRAKLFPQFLQAAGFRRHERHPRARGAAGFRELFLLGSRRPATRASGIRGPDRGPVGQDGGNHVLGSRVITEAAGYVFLFRGTLLPLQVIFWFNAFPTMYPRTTLALPFTGMTLFRQETASSTHETMPSLDVMASEPLAGRCLGQGGRAGSPRAGRHPACDRRSRPGQEADAGHVRHRVPTERERPLPARDHQPWPRGPGCRHHRGVGGARRWTQPAGCGSRPGELEATTPFPGPWPTASAAISAARAGCMRWTRTSCGEASWNGLIRR
jgi:hypothetical protein